jgi:hypothetical protein
MTGVAEKYGWDVVAAAWHQAALIMGERRRMIISRLDTGQ